MSKQPPTRTYCKRNRPLPYYYPNCRTPRHWKFTQDHRTTRPPPVADLSDVNNIAKDNDGIRYLLFVIDIFSRFLWVKPLKNKTAKSVLEALKDVLKKRKPVRLRVDKGSEFVNRWVKKYLKDNDIYLFVTQSSKKANYAETVIKTFRLLLWRYLRHKRNYRYIDDLQKLVDNYNATPHRSLNFIASKDVNRSNEADLWAFMYLRKPAKEAKRTPKKRTAPYKFKLGDLVRISHIKHPFRRGGGRVVRWCWVNFQCRGVLQFGLQ